MIGLLRSFSSWLTRSRLGLQPRFGFVILVALPRRALFSEPTGLEGYAVADDSEISFKFVASGEAVADAFTSIGDAGDKASKKVEAAWAREIKKADQVARAAQKVADQKQKAEEKAAQASAKSYEYVYQIKQRYLQAEERALDKKVRAEQKAAEQVRKAWAQAGMGAARQIAGELGAGALMHGLRGMFQSASSFAISTIGGAVREAIKLQSMARRISIDARKGGEKFTDPTAIRMDLEKAALLNPGVTAEGVGASVAEYRQRTGNLDEARQFAGVFATTKSAVGDNASSEQIGKAASILSKQFDIHSVQDMGDAMGKLVFAAKESGQPLHELVSRFDKLGAAAKSYKLGGGVEGLNKLLALNAMAREGVGERAAPTAVQGLMRSLKQNAMKIKQATGDKVDPYADKAGNMKPIEQTIAGLFSYTKHGGDKDNMNEVAKSVSKIVGQRSMEAMSPLFNVYKKTYGDTQGSQETKAAAATAAVIEKFRELEKASGDYEELQKDAAQAQLGPAEQIAGAYEKLKAAAGEELAPTLTKFALDVSKNKGAFEALVLVIEGLSAAMSAMIDKLQRAGIISGGTAKERADSAANKAADLEAEQRKLLKGRGYLELSTEEKSTYRGNQTEIFKQQALQEEARKEQMGENTAKGKIGEKTTKGGADMTMVDQYLKAGGSRFTGILGGALGDSAAGLFGETSSQRAIRNAGEHWVPPGGETTKGAAMALPGPGVGPSAAAPADTGAASEAQRQLLMLGESAAKAKTAMDDLAKTRQPSIVGDHQ